ncbi:MAG: cytochrome c4 [Herminiimonas sp.]|nr:cytochrome c4 [Herminiimonas sp.]
MNRLFLAVVKTVSIVAFAISSSGHAAEGKKGTPPDPVKGEAIYTNGDAARGLPACVSCHGAAGASTIALNPKLGGQHEAYIYKQLVNFKGPDRKQAVMTTYATMLSDGDMENIAAYLDKQPAKAGAAKNKDTVDLGKRIYRAGIAEKNVPACAACHGPNGAGIPAQFARLGGQHQEYTTAQLMNFRSGARKNSIQMTTIAKRLSDDEMQAVADYVAGLH